MRCHVLTRFLLVPLCLLFASSAMTQSTAWKKTSQTGPRFTTKKTVPGDPLLQVVPSAWAGKLAYAFAEREFDREGNAVNKLVPLCLALRFWTAQGKENAIYYEYEMPAENQKRQEYFSVFEPQFSPDGRYVLFKWGGMADYDSYRLFVMDIASGKLSLVNSPGLVYRKVLWSPDSQYLAFVEGGDPKGNLQRLWIDGWLYLGPLKLHVCEWRTGRRWLVVQNDGVKEGFSWAAPHSLLYSALATAQKAPAPPKPKAALPAKSTVSRPNIFEFSPDDGQSRLVLRDGLRPHVSPDGKLIAFWGSEDAAKPYPLPSDWLDYSHNASLCVAQRDGNGRAPLTLEEGKYSSVMWRPDSRFLIAVQAIDTDENGREKPRLDVTLWNVAERTQNKVGTLNIKDFGVAIIRLVPRSFAPDGSNLYFSTFQNVGYPFGKKGGSVLTDQEELHTLSLKTGRVETQFRFKHDRGFDWQPE